MESPIPKSDGQARSIDVTTLVRLTARVPDMAYYPGLKSRLEALLEVLSLYDAPTLTATLNELGKDPHLRDTIGTESAPGALRAFIKSPAEASHVLRATLQHWHHCHTTDTQAPTAEPAPTPQQVRGTTAASRLLRPTSDDEAYARGLIADDDLRPRVTVRRRSEG